MGFYVRLAGEHRRDISLTSQAVWRGIERQNPFKANLSEPYLSPCFEGDGYRTLQEEDRVSFEIVQGPKGPQSASVAKVEGI